MSAREPISREAETAADLADAFLAWEQETALPRPKRPRVTRNGRTETIEDVDGWGRPITTTRTVEQP